MPQLDLNRPGRGPCPPQGDSPVAHHRDARSNGNYATISRIGTERLSQRIDGFGEPPVRGCIFERIPMTVVMDPISELRETAQQVRLAQAGDRDAFGWLFERYHARILAHIRRRMRDEHAAQELAQDVFVQALQKIGQLRTPECFGAWLRRIAVRMTLNRQQRHRVAPPLDAWLGELALVDECDPAVSAVRHEQVRQVRGGLERLRPLDRNTLVAFYLRGQSLHEMAGEFSAPVGTIKRRLHVARKRLAAALD